MTYEDGRKGTIKATLEIRDAKTVPVAPERGWRRNEGPVARAKSSYEDLRRRGNFGMKILGWRRGERSK